MADKTARIALSVPPEVRDTFKECSELMGVPMAQMIGNLLIESEPQFKALIQPLRDLKSAKVGKDKVLTDLKKSAKEHQQNIDDLLK